MINLSQLVLICFLNCKRRIGVRAGMGSLPTSECYNYAVFWNLGTLGTPNVFVYITETQKVNRWCMQCMQKLNF